MLKNDMHKSIFGNIDFFAIWRMRHCEKGLENEVSPYGKNGEFFLRDLHTLGKHKAKYPLYKNVFPQKIYCTRTITDRY